MGYKLHVFKFNSSKLASATLFTLFWAGDILAPNERIDGKNLKQFLQGSYIKCFTHLANRLKGCPNVLGFEAMNEPHPGYIGLPLISRHFDQNKNLNLGQRYFNFLEAIKITK